MVVLCQWVNLTGWLKSLNSRPCLAQLFVVHGCPFKYESTLSRGQASLNHFQVINS